MEKRPPIKDARADGILKILILTKRRARLPLRADTLALALSHKGRGDLLVAIRAWLNVTGMVAILWIPAFAGMTGSEFANGGE